MIPLNVLTVLVLVHFSVCQAFDSDRNSQGELEKQSKELTSNLLPGGLLQADKVEILLCRKCGGDVADSSYLIDRFSSSAQGFRKENLFGRNVLIQKLVNPYGIKFDVITAEKARCDNIGPAQGADTWFPGHTWRICTCPHCNQFLGWTFQKIDSTDPTEISTFHGLVLTNVLGENFTDSLIMMPKTQSM